MFGNRLTETVVGGQAHLEVGIGGPQGGGGIAEREVWESCRTSGVYLPTEFGRDGFIHLSGLHQVLTPANRFYAGRRDLVALVVDAHLISNALVWEPGTGTQEYFPHLYGALGADAVLAEIPFPPETDGSFLLPPELVKVVRR